MSVRWDNTIIHTHSSCVVGNVFPVAPPLLAACSAADERVRSGGRSGPDQQQGGINCNVILLMLLSCRRLLAHGAYPRHPGLQVPKRNGHGLRSRILRRRGGGGGGGRGGSSGCRRVRAGRGGRGRRGGVLLSSLLRRLLLLGRSSCCGSILRCAARLGLCGRRGVRRHRRRGGRARRRSGLATWQKRRRVEIMQAVRANIQAAEATRRRFAGHKGRGKE